jgi:hypothetical protein
MDFWQVRGAREPSRPIILFIPLIWPPNSALRGTEDAELGHGAKVSKNWPEGRDRPMPSVWQASQWKPALSPQSTETATSPVRPTSCTTTPLALAPLHIRVFAGVHLSKEYQSAFRWLPETSVPETFCTALSSPGWGGSHSAAFLICTFFSF